MQNACTNEPLLLGNNNDHTIRHMVDHRPDNVCCACTCGVCRLSVCTVWHRQTMSHVKKKTGRLHGECRQM